MNKFWWLMVFVWCLSACQQEFEVADRPSSSSASQASIETPSTAEQSTQPEAIPTEGAAPEEIVIEVTRVIELFVEQTEVLGEKGPHKEMTICMATEPDSAYRFQADFSPSELALHHAIYENDFTYLNYQYRPVGLEKLPNFDDRDLFFREIEVIGGETVIDAVTGLPVELLIGVPIKNMAGETVTFNGGPITMQQMVVDFKLKPRTWSDGRPVLASDSVYGFSIASHPDTPTDKFRFVRTAEYVALDEKTLRWVGIPGFIDPEFLLNFAKPLPEHLLRTLTPAEMVDADLTARRPIGDGPFRIAEWQPGRFIRLEANRNYYLREAGYPKVDEITFRFISESSALIQQLLNGECDIGTQELFDFSHAPIIMEAEVRNQLVGYFHPGRLYEHIDFGINSFGGYGDAAGRPDWFEDQQVRQAITLCTDRQRMVDEIFLGTSAVMHSYFPDNHPLFTDTATVWPFDPVQGNQLLDDAGFQDEDEDGIREAFDQRPFNITLGIAAGNLMRQQIGQIFAENMRECGIVVDLVYRPAEEWYAAGPEGPLFGRRFDLAEFAWPVDEFNSCQLYTSAEIPGPAENGFVGWQGLNHTGWSDSRFDSACNMTIDSLPGSEAYVEGHRLAQEIFSVNLPSMPLFQRMKVAATRPGIIHFDLDTTQPSELYNIYEIDIEE